MSIDSCFTNTVLELCGFGFNDDVRKLHREHILEGSNSNDTIEASPWLLSRLIPNNPEARWPDPLFIAPISESGQPGAGESCFTLLASSSGSVSNWSLAYSTELPVVGREGAPVSFRSSRSSSSFPYSALCAMRSLSLKNIQSGMKEGET